MHIAAWVLLFSLPSLLRPPYENKQPAHSSESHDGINWLYLGTVVILIGIFYLNALVLIPKYINRKKYWQYALSQFVTLIALLIVNGGIFVLLAKKGFNLRGHILFNLFTFLFMGASSTAYQLIRDRMKSEKLAGEKENENLKTELSFLRSQVSPHFMFNVLNNMVALARKNSDQLEPSLIKLSSLMRYMLYETDEQKVPLYKEIEYLRSYIDLQQQRFGKSLTVTAMLDVTEGNYEIEPMLLIPFVENAFKHGTGMIENPEIHIELKTEKGILQFAVRNKYNGSIEEVRDNTSGIGLTNVKRRLNLLYGTQHNLWITKKDSWFLVTLQLNLH
jgi:two-component system LytT family sensor kinase